MATNLFVKSVATLSIIVMNAASSSNALSVRMDFILMKLVIVHRIYALEMSLETVSIAMLLQLERQPIALETVALSNAQEYG